MYPQNKSFQQFSTPLFESFGIGKQFSTAVWEIPSVTAPGTAAQEKPGGCAAAT